MERIAPIKTEAEYQAVMQRIESLMMSDNEADKDLFEVLAILADDYENKHYPIEPPDPKEAIRFRMEQLGLKQKDLMQYIGTESRVSEVLNGKRDLTVDMIRNLHRGLNIPTSILLGV